tara:strand:+ start:2504 stop:3268 length:765 start_codon:yes stop_codon:yes gene_type:complete
MIDKILRVAVAGVQAARSGLAACVFKSNPTKILYRKGLIVALLGVSALSVTHIASATLITVEADVLANTGSSVTFAQSDQSLGTLTGAQLTYSFVVTYPLFNDWGIVDANDWSLNSAVRVAGIGFAETLLNAYTQEVTYDIPEGDGQALATLTGAVTLTLAEIDGWAGAILRVSTRPIIMGNDFFIGPGAGDGDAIFSSDPYVPNVEATASLGYTYDPVSVSGTRATTVPAPPTLALFTLGLMVIAARRVKARK